MFRSPDPPEPPDTALPSFADLVFRGWACDAVHHAVTLIGAAPAPEVEAFLATLYERAEATQDPRTRRVLARLQAIQACLPPDISPRDVMAILVTLDPTVLRGIQSRLTEALTQLGRRRPAMQAAQRQVERLTPLWPRSTRVTREEAAEWAQARGLYQRTRRLISRLASPKREPWLTAEARQLFEHFTRAGLSPWPAYGLVAAVLGHWHPETALTAAHIRARLQPRAKRRPPTPD
jgi:hypothetical protein